jgi:cytochrome c oxidase subunit 2
VIHSFWVPAFLYKKDVIPGKTNYMYLTPERIGTYAGKCAELCGEFHSAMLFNVKVVSEADYQAHIASLKAAGYTGQLDSTYNRNQNLPGTSAPKSNG